MNDYKVNSALKVSVKERESEEIRCGDVVDHSWRKAPESLVASRQEI